MRKGDYFILRAHFSLVHRIIASWCESSGRSPTLGTLSCLYIDRTIDHPFKMKLTPCYVYSFYLLIFLLAAALQKNHGAFAYVNMNMHNCKNRNRVKNGKERTQFSRRIIASAICNSSRGSNSNSNNNSEEPSSSNNNMILMNVVHRCQSAWNSRLNAEPQFAKRFAYELFLAATLQGIAEFQRRRRNFILEIDYVISGIFVAIVGKGLAAFRSAPSIGAGTLTNAFQFGDYPLLERLVAFIVTPAPRLFMSGLFAGFLGFSLSQLLTISRSILFKSSRMNLNIAPSVPLVPGAIYTGFFLVFVSGPSYQILSGAIEQRIIDKLLPTGG